jgi:membrane protease YdiL (CAAX protease family)
MTETKGISYPNNEESWAIVGIIILSSILCAPVYILLINITGKEISILVHYLLSFGIALWIIHNKRKERTGVSRYNFDSSSAKIIVMVSIAMIAIGIGIISPIVNLIPLFDFEKTMFLELAKQTGILSFITIVIAAPILEEMIFRGIILDGLLKKYSPLKSIIISSILFGVAHLNPHQFVAALIIGFFSGWVYYKTKNLTLSIMIHFVNNLFAFGSRYFIDAETMMDKSLPELYGGFLYFIMITFGAIILAVICLYFLRLELKNIGMSYGSTQLNI